MTMLQIQTKRQSYLYTKCIHITSWLKLFPLEWVSDWMIVFLCQDINVSATFVYHGENKLCCDEMMRLSVSRPIGGAGYL